MKKIALLLIALASPAGAQFGGSSPSFNPSGQGNSVTISTSLVVTGSATVQGALNAGGSAFVVSGGSVGVATASPALVFDVNGSAQFGPGSTKSTFTADGALILVNKSGSPSASKGALYFDSTANVFKGSLDGASFVQLTTGASGSGLTVVNSNAVQFSGDGNGQAITLKSSTVTLQGNTFNGASQLLLLTAGGVLPVLNGAALTNISASTIAATGVNAGTLGATVIASSVGANGVSAGTYGSATQSSQITVSADGRATTVANVTISGVSPAGSAGGVLAGAYPNPQFGSLVVLSSHVAASAITDAKVSLSTAAIGTGKFGDDRVLISTSGIVDVSTAIIRSGKFGDNRVLISTAGLVDSSTGFIQAGKFDDNRVSVTTGAIKGGFNGASQFVQLNSGTQLPAVDGSLLTNITAISLSTSAVAPTAGTLLGSYANNSSPPRNICFSGGLAYVTNNGSNTVNVMIATGTSAGTVTETINISSGPYGCVNDGFGSMWFTQFSTNSVAKMALTKNAQGLHNTTYYTILQHAAHSIDTDGSGSVALVSASSASFIVVTATGGVAALKTSQFSSPDGIKWCNGAFGVTDSASFYSITSAGVSTLYALSSPVNAVHGTPACDGLNWWGQIDGTLFIRISSGGTVSIFGGGGAGSQNSFGFPAAAVFDGKSIFNAGSTVRMNTYGVDGFISTATFTTALTNGLHRCAYNAGSIWCTSNKDNTVYRFAATNQFDSRITDTPFAFEQQSAGVAPYAGYIITTTCASASTCSSYCPGQFAMVACSGTDSSATPLLQGCSFTNTSCTCTATAGTGNITVYLKCGNY